MPPLLAAALAAALCAAPSLVGRTAPEMLVEKWALPEGTAGPRLSELRGKVVAVLFFQTTCSSCHGSGIPLFQELERVFAGTDLVTVYVQTAFENAALNTFESGRMMIQNQYKLKGPFGQDRVMPGQHVPATFSRYRSGGTPWVILVDRSGNVVYADFPDYQKKMLERVKALLDPASAPSSPAPSAGP